MFMWWKRRIISAFTLAGQTIFPWKKGRGQMHFEDTQNCGFSLFWTFKHITHHSLFSASKWTSLVGSRQPSSSAWQCCGKGLPGTSASFPSFFAGPCMPTHSPGMAGRSTMPGARSYSSTCFRTANGQQGWVSSRSGDVPPPVGRRTPASAASPDFPGWRPARHVRKLANQSTHTSDYLSNREMNTGFHQPGASQSPLKSLK